MVAIWVEKRRRRAVKELGGDVENIVARVSKEVREELRLDYLITGSWSLKASHEAARLLGPLGTNLVNVAVDSRKANAGKFGTIPDEDTWSLTPTMAQGGTGSAFVYYCDNETVDGVEFPALPRCLKTSSEDRDHDGRCGKIGDISWNLLNRMIEDGNRYYQPKSQLQVGFISSTE